ncbi:MAG: serine/threonine protein kinase, partial [Burkholderiaceae bacterium]
MTDPTAPPFAGLTPDTVLDAIDATGLFAAGQVLALNSYENRVFQVGLDEPLAGARFVIAKFYRPGRWSDAQILEEHAFLAELVEAEVPAVAPIVMGGRTLLEHAGFRYALFPRRGGRAPELEDAATLEWLGRFLGRIHVVGARRVYQHRPALDLQTYGVEPRAFLLETGCLPPELASVYAGVSQQVLDGVARAFERAGAVRQLRLHGDVHEGNVLWTDHGPHFVDFDDSRMGPAVQDLWMLLGHEREEQQRRLTD